jgi:O-antigen ligase
MRTRALWPDDLAARRYPGAMRFVVVGLVLIVAVAAGLALGLRGTGKLRAEVILAGVALISSIPLWLRLRRLEYGIVATLLAAGLLNTITLPTGTHSRVPISMVVAAACVGLWLFKTIWGPKAAPLKPSLINTPLLAFVAIGFLSYGWGTLMRDPTVYVWKSFPFVQLAALAVNTLLPLTALFVANQIEDVRWLRLIAWIILGLGAFAVVSNLLSLPMVAAISSGSRGLFATWVGVLAYSQLLFNRDLRRAERLLLLGLFLAVVYLYFFVYAAWLSGWVPLAVACAAATMLHSRKLTAFVGLVLAVYLAFNSTSYFRDLVQAEVASGSLERLSIWGRNLGLVALHPLFGMGPAGYAVYNMSYFPLDARSTHNNYFDILAQNGIAGLALFAWLFVAFIRTASWARRAWRGQTGFEIAFANAVLAGSFGVVVSMMLGDWVSPFPYNETITGFNNAVFTWIMLGAGVSLCRMGGAGPRLSSDGCI